MALWLTTIGLVIRFLPRYEFLPPLCTIPFCLCQGALVGSFLQYSVRETVYREGMRCEFCGIDNTIEDKWLTGADRCGHVYHMKCYNESVKMTPQFLKEPCPICTQSNQIELEIPLRHLVVDLRENVPDASHVQG